LPPQDQKTENINKVFVFYQSHSIKDPRKSETSDASLWKIMIWKIICSILCILLSVEYIECTEKSQEIFFMGNKFPDYFFVSPFCHKQMSNIILYWLKYIKHMAQHQQKITRSSQS